MKLNFVLLSSFVLLIPVTTQRSKTDCHQVIKTSKSGLITSPNYPAYYKDGLTCTWLIRVPRGMVIELVTKFFRIEGSYNCENDALYIYDGPGINARLYSKPFCDSKGPRNVESSGNTLFLKFISDSENNNRGFEIEYRAKKVCDYEFVNKKVGWFTSPRFPKNYYENANCTYRIKTERNNAIRIHFTDFFLENRVNGKCLDYVAVYNVIAGIPRLFKTYCGVGIPTPITSTASEVLVRFHSDSFLDHQGFNATFQTLYHLCKPNEFKCGNGRCVSVDLICNNQNDCYDNSDETFCCTKFTCDNRRCISESQVCDMINNCGDWSDEKNCGKNPTTATTRTTSSLTPTSVLLSTLLPTKTFYPPCPYAEFTCNNKKCIDASLRCNGHDDCGDSTDEICSGQCRNMNGQCQHICIDNKNKVTCSCYPGFSLDSDKHSCIDIDECSSRPCAEICDNTYGSYKCGCRTGYRLAEDGHSCTDFDECSQYKKRLCEQQCINTVGSYRCTCYPGYVFHAEKQACTDVNECVLENGGCAENCVNTIGSYRCQCSKRGYQMVPGKTYCEEINECELGTASCSQICTNTDGGYECSCRPGYRLNHDLHTCVDIDECLVGVPGCWGGCINTFGSYRCECDSGFKGIMNETRCEDINECQSRNGGCSNQCINTHGSFSCKCPNGFKARDHHSYTCDDINECESDPCEGKCLNTPGSFECTCSKGYKLVNKTKCDDVNECNDGAHGCTYKCVNTDGSFFCTCPDGFILDSDGRRCLKALNGTGCKRSKVDLPSILTSQWTNVTDGWKWQVGISVDFPGLLNIPRYKCIGVLVDEKFVLTAGHCLRLGYITVNPSKTLLSFGGYEHGFRKAKLNKRAKSIHFHSTLDLALVGLEMPVKDSSDIQPVCLPLPDHVDLSIGQKLVTVAWPSRGVVKPLRQIMTTIDSHTTCNWDGRYIFRKESSICVRFGLPQHLRSLPLSGAPLLGMLRGTLYSRKRQRWYLSGVLIHGNGYPGKRETISSKYHHVGYQKVTSFSDWMKETIDQNQ